MASSNVTGVLVGRGNLDSKGDTTCLCREKGRVMTQRGGAGTAHQLTFERREEEAIRRREERSSVG